jgi:S-adenosylmethionine-diacylglycerol 3-amino-3-carboxypropyl transferase
MVRHWFSERIFRLIHGHSLVYNTCWEDPRLDRHALQLTPADSVAMITSAGCNALDYVLDNPREIHAVDLNFRQNALLHLKIAAIRHLSFDDLFAMFGTGRLAGAGRIYADRLRCALPIVSQQFWDRRIKWFDHPRKSFYFRGTSGAFARAMNFYLDRVAGVRPWVNAILAAETLGEQRRLFEEKLWPRFWRPVIRGVVSRDTTLALLGVPRAQRLEVERSFPGGIAGFVHSCLRTVFTERSMRDNYFWRVYLTGAYTPDCCPEYLKPSNAERLKNGLLDRIRTHTASLNDFLRQHPRPISRFVLLDHMDWLADHRPHLLQEEWQAILDRAEPNARVIWRSGGLRSDFVTCLKVKHRGQPRSLSQLLALRPELADVLHGNDRVATYGSFHIADLAA